MKRCIQCGNKELRRAEQTELLVVGSFEFEGLVDSWRCAECGEEYTDGQDLACFELFAAKWLVDQGVATREAFRFMRKAIGLRAVDIATLLDVTPETVSHWETGKHAIPRNVLATMGGLVLDHAAGATTTRDRLKRLEKPHPLRKRKKIHLGRCA